MKWVIRLWVLTFLMGQGCGFITNIHSGHVSLAYCGLAATIFFFGCYSFCEYRFHQFAKETKEFDSWLDQKQREFLAAHYIKNNNL
jgi:hypothetical protein